MSSSLSLRDRNPLKYDDAIVFTDSGHTYSYKYVDEDTGEVIEILPMDIVSVSTILKYAWDEPPLDHMAAATYQGLLTRYFEFLKLPDRINTVNSMADTNAINLRVPGVQNAIYYDMKHKVFLIYLICVHNNKKSKNSKNVARNTEYYDELFLYLLERGKIKPLEDEGYYEFPLAKYSMVSDVRNFWSLQTQKGTAMHKFIEDFLDYGIKPDATREESYDFYRWLSWYTNDFNKLDMTVFRIELRVFNVELRLAGSIDCVCKNSDGTFTLIDWKRIKNIEESYKNNKGFNPKTYEILNGLPQEFGEDNVFGSRKIDKTFGQLGTYKFLFESMSYGKVTRLICVCEEPRGTKATDVYIITDLAKVNNQVLALIAKRRELLDLNGG